MNTERPIEKAIQYFEKLWPIEPPQEVKYTLSVLRAKQERESGGTSGECSICGIDLGPLYCKKCYDSINTEQPLTLEQLKERVGKVVWRDHDYPVRIVEFTDWRMVCEMLGSEIPSTIGINAIEGKFYDHQPQEPTNGLTLYQLRSHIGHNITAVRKSDRTVKAGSLQRIDPIDIDNVMVYGDGFAELFHENDFYET